jgi:hypothetical protein
MGFLLEDGDGDDGRIVRDPGYFVKGFAGTPGRVAHPPGDSPIALFRLF